MKGVHGLLLQHLDDGHGKIASAIDALPLDQHEKTLLQAMENMEGSVLTTTLEAIRNIQMSVIVQGADKASLTASDGSPSTMKTPPRTPPAKPTTSPGYSPAKSENRTSSLR